MRDRKKLLDTQQSSDRFNWCFNSFLSCSIVCLWIPSDFWLIFLQSSEEVGANSRENVYGLQMASIVLPELDVANSKNWTWSFSNAKLETCKITRCEMWNDRFFSRSFPCDALWMISPFWTFFRTRSKSRMPWSESRGTSQSGLRMRTTNCRGWLRLWTSSQYPR